MSLPVYVKGDNSKTKIYNLINLYFLIHLFKMNPTVPNMTGYDEVKIMMTSFPVPDDFPFSGIPRLVHMYILFFNLKRLFKAIIGDKWVTSGLEKVL